MPANTPMKIKRNRLYPTYQILLDVYPENGITAEGCFSKVILYIMEWIRKKTDDGFGIDALSSFPPVENYNSFRIEDAPVIKCDTPLKLRTYYFDKCFAMKFTERNPDFNGEFITNISVSLKEGTVLLAVRTECRQPEGETEAKSMRPWYIGQMIDDKDLTLTEAGIQKDFKIKRGVLSVSGKSNEDLKKLFDGLVNNPERRMPVMFFPMPEEGFGIEEIDDQAGHIMGFYHSVVIDRSYNKFFRTIMPASEYIEYLSGYQAVLHIDSKENGENVFVCIPCDEILADHLRDLRGKEPLGRNIDFSGVRFLSELYNAFYQNEIKKAKEDGNDAVIIESLSRQNAELQDQLSADDRDLKDKDTTISRLQTELDQKENSLNRVIREKERGEKDAQDKIDKANNRVEQMEKDLQAANMRIMASENMAGFNDELTDLLIGSVSLFGGDEKENYIKWVDQYYKDTIILHDKAREAIRKDNTPRNWNDICQATHYLSSVVRILSKGNINMQDAGVAATNYCRKLKGFQVTGSMSDTTKNMYGDKYTIDIAACHGRSGPEPVYLDEHIKIGVDAEKLTRIYFYYDGELKKAIIGYLPGHLPTSSW